MRILAIDTSSKFLCLGVYDDGKIYEYNVETGKKLSGLITLTIERVLKALGLGVGDIDYFAVGLGPGSFTGMRVGASTIKGLSWVMKKPVIGISTLDIIAENAAPTSNDVVPIIDAKRGLVYCAIYKKASGVIAKRKSPYLLLTFKELSCKLKANSLLFGDACEVYRQDILKDVKGAVILDKEHWYPKAHNIIKLALERQKAKKISNAFKIEPIYLYPKECQIKIKNI
ncbi:MAG: tRNA (adenosine(37)-N6)-threonylcarbamoyltransferase complex dimerization subunit type 1 TsaB [Candidatus Omnitrophica bacterium]|nr:tRNA (adenosine(37)-N6)-threonylcarbamoyltransferase complex dimerization subunit type 1 TsaB [Candidatus Omnitrophota bacterium]